MWELFNFSNPIIAVINMLILVSFVLSGVLLYKIASLYEFYDKAKRHNNKNETLNETVVNNKDFEPFFGGFSRKSSFSSFSHDDYVNTVFDEYAKHFSKVKKEKVEDSNRVIQSKVESFPESYKILGFKTIPKSEKEIKDKYKQLAKRLHPDAGGSQELFVKVTEAYKESLEIWKGRKNRL